MFTGQNSQSNGRTLAGTVADITGCDAAPAGGREYTGPSTAPAPSLTVLERVHSLENASSNDRDITADGLRTLHERVRKLESVLGLL